ncbi:uncharacterized protein TNCV_625881 [Trichonephila clavipes]|nr:uncharacterized protein TNCV_625881 [Trichonephila clavipes]
MFQQKPTDAWPMSSWIRQLVQISTSYISRKDDIDTGKGFPQEIIKIIKPHYMKLCDKNLLNKCLHGKTQNANESFNGILWKFIPKDIFVELQTLRLGAHVALIQFNKGFRGLLDALNRAQVQVGANTEKAFAQLDEERVSESKRHPLSEVKTSRKKT